MNIPHKQITFFSLIAMLWVPVGAEIISYSVNKTHYFQQTGVAESTSSGWGLTADFFAMLDASGQVTLESGAVSVPMAGISYDGGFFVARYSSHSDSTVFDSPAELNAFWPSQADYTYVYSDDSTSGSVSIQIGSEAWPLFDENPYITGPTWSDALGGFIGDIGEELNLSWTLPASWVLAHSDSIGVTLYLICDQDYDMTISYYYSSDENLLDSLEVYLDGPGEYQGRLVFSQINTWDEEFSEYGGNAGHAAELDFTITVIPESETTTLLPGLLAFVGLVIARRSRTALSTNRPYDTVE